MNTDIEVRPASGKGLGVFARRSFRKGEFIFRRRHGRTVRGTALGTLTYDEQEHLCELDFDHSAVLLGPGRFLNHSCDPNALRSGVKVFARRRIRREEEITIDYRLNAFSGEPFRCHCGTTACTGIVVNSFFALPDSRQREYLPYAPRFIKQEYRRLKRAKR